MIHGSSDSILVRNKSLKIGKCSGFNFSELDPQRGLLKGKKML